MDSRKLSRASDADYPDPLRKPRHTGGAKTRAKRVFLLAPALLMLLASTAVAQERYPLMDKIANRIIAKYQNSSCQQLRQRKSEPKRPMERDFLRMLRNDPEMRRAFIDKVAGPIANKMFDCGMIP